MKKSLFLLILLLPACKKETASPFVAADSFIFGTSYGECGGDCARLFKLENDHLYPDDNVKYLPQAGDPVPFQSQSLPSDKVALAKTLLAEAPAGLYGETQEIIGCPDCRDQGTIFIEIRTGDQVRKWYVDPDSDKYGAFCDSVRSTVLKMPF